MRFKWFTIRALLGIRLYRCFGSPVAGIPFQDTLPLRIRTQRMLNSNFAFGSFIVSPATSIVATPHCGARSFRLTSPPTKLLRGCRPFYAKNCPLDSFPGASNPRQSSAVRPAFSYISATSIVATAHRAARSFRLTSPLTKFPLPAVVRGSPFAGTPARAAWHAGGLCWFSGAILNFSACFTRLGWDDMGRDGNTEKIQEIVDKQRGKA